MSLNISRGHHHGPVPFLHVPGDVPELLGDGVPRLGDVPLDHDLVLPLELLEDEGAHDAVAHHERQQPDVREEEAAVANLRLYVGDFKICQRLREINPDVRADRRDHAPLQNVQLVL